MRDPATSDSTSVSVPTIRNQLASSIAARDTRDSAPPLDLPFLPFPSFPTNLILLPLQVEEEDAMNLEMGILETDGDWLGDIDARFEKSRCEFPSDEEIRTFNSRVCVYTSDTEYVVHCGTSELYLISNLRERVHSFENNTPLPNPQTSPRAQMSHPQGVNYFTDNVSLVRLGTDMYDEHFGGLPIDISMLIRFVLKHGRSDEKRDGIEATTSNKKRRFDFGCCGQSWEKLDDGTNVPKSTYGMQIFENETNDLQVASVKQMLAKSLDAMQVCVDTIEMKHLRNGKPYGCEERTNRFGKKLREAIGASLSRFENVTLQIKCLNRGERTEGHTDDNNCTWNGYQKTCAFSFCLRDAYNDFWSIKIIVNSRANAGHYLNKKLKLTELLTRIRRQADFVNHEYQKFMMDYKGKHQYTEKLTYNTFHLLVLDDDCPWTRADLGGDGLCMQHMKFPAAPVRDLFLAPPTTVVYLHHQRTNNRRKSIELAVMAGYQNGFHRYFYVGMNHLDELVKADHPAFVYHKEAKDAFGTAFCDVFTGRISPTDIDFAKLYLNDDGEMNHVMDVVVGEVVVALDWIEKNVGTKDFNHVEIEKMVRERLDAVKDKTKCRTGIGEFRFMMILQICCMAGIMQKGHKDLHNLVYPVASLGAAEQLEHVDRKDRPAVLHCIISECHLEDYGTNAGEGTLCETSESRVTNIFDYIMKGMFQFMFDQDGNHLVKMYGKSCWEKMIFTCRV